MYTEDVLLVVLEVVRREAADHGHGDALLHDLLLQRADLVLVLLALLLERLACLLLLAQELLLQLLQFLRHLGLQVDSLLRHELLVRVLPVHLAVALRVAVVVRVHVGAGGGVRRSDRALRHALLAGCNQYAGV